VINVNPAKSPASDVLIARLSNAGPARDNFFGMQPSGKATYRLYATPRFDAAHGAAMWKLVEVDGATGALTTVREGWFHDCQHNRVPTRADADFFPCTPHPLGSKFAKFKKAGMFTGFFSDRILAMMFPADTTDRDPNDPPWISCTTGCCTLEQ
jgi:hypothetical protein